MVLVKELVDRELYFVQPTDTVAEVIRKMAGLRVGAILVMEEGVLRGVFSERDVLIRVVLAKLDPENTLVGDVMTKNVTTVSEGASIDMAMESMRLRGCRHLPVMRGDQVAGFLSMRDLLRHDLHRKTEELMRMRAYIHGAT
jgi:hypothetical protein